MTEGAVKLLREIAPLLRRHPPKDFEELAEALRRPDFTTTLARVLNEVAAKGRAHGISPRAVSVTTLLENLKSSDPAKYQLLRDAQERLLDKRLYPSLPDLKKAIEASGLLLPKTVFRKREEVVRSFVRTARAKTVEEIQQALLKIPAEWARSDLRSWSNIIVPKQEQKDSPKV